MTHVESVRQGKKKVRKGIRTVGRMLLRGLLEEHPNPEKWTDEEKGTLSLARAYIMNDQVVETILVKHLEKFYKEMPK